MVAQLLASGAVISSTELVSYLVIYFVSYLVTLIASKFNSYLE
jgi:hypothetical protein